MNSHNFFLLIICFFLLFIKTSYAYLDPGSGSLILQVILGALAAALVFIKRIIAFFKEKINVVLKLFRKEKNKK